MKHLPDRKPLKVYNEEQKKEVELRHRYLKDMWQKVYEAGLVEPPKNEIQ